MPRRAEKLSHKNAALGEKRGKELDEVLVAEALEEDGEGAHFRKGGRPRAVGSYDHDLFGSPHGDARVGCRQRGRGARNKKGR